MKDIFKYLDRVEEIVNYLVIRYKGLNNIPLNLINKLTNKYSLYNEYKDKISAEKKKLKVEETIDYYMINNNKYFVSTQFYLKSKEIDKKFIVDRYENMMKLEKTKEGKVNIYYNNRLLYTYINSKSGFSKNTILDLIKLMYLRTL